MNAAVYSSLISSVQVCLILGWIELEDDLFPLSPLFCLYLRCVLRSPADICPLPLAVLTTLHAATLPNSVFCVLPVFAPPLSKALPPPPPLPLACPVLSCLACPRPVFVLSLTVPLFPSPLSFSLPPHSSDPSLLRRSRSATGRGESDLCRCSRKTFFAFCRLFVHLYYRQPTVKRWQSMAWDWEVGTLKMWHLAREQELCYRWSRAEPPEAQLCLGDGSVFPSDLFIHTFSWTWTLVMAQHLVCKDTACLVLNFNLELFGLCCTHNKGAWGLKSSPIFSSGNLWAV